MKTKADKFLIVITAVVLSFFVGLALYASQPKETVTSASPQVTEIIPLNATKIFDLVNAERVKAGLKPLVRDARLDATAQARADDMVARNYFSHYDPVTGENLAKILNKYYPDPCSKVSENIIKIVTPEDKNSAAVEWWMNSKPHHDAILLPEYTLTGVAVNGNIGVQHFCIAK